MNDSDSLKGESSHTSSSQRPEDYAPEKDKQDAEKESRSLHQKKRFWATLGAVVILVLVMLNASTGGADALMQSFSRSQTSVSEPVTAPAPEREDREYKLSNFSHHPDVLFQPYMAGPIMGGSTDASGSVNLLNQFRELLDVYVLRQATDDNFTVRIIDGRTRETLEVFELEGERAEYERTGEADWMGEIDDKRTRAMRRLIRKYVQRGIPRGPIMVKFGRANQVQEAQKRNEPFIEYEVRLARYLNLSLLATQVSTVETFNQSRLVSSAGARSRYQMMPYILSQQDIHQYNLRTAAGNTIHVREEWHPLLTMEPAFKLMRGFANAVGHEIPGISAYHTGPGNIYKVYRNFMRQAPKLFEASSTVMDAYMWATTEGYSYMSEHTSFGPFSRGYIASAYGALKAVEDVPIDTSKTMQAVRVQLKPDATIRLSELLGALDKPSSGASIASVEDVTPAANTSANTPSSESTTESEMSLYNRFRALNEHMPLPATTDASGVPARGDVRLVRAVGGEPVRFFLPLGAPKQLRAAGLDVLDPDVTFRFDHDTFQYPEHERTVWDGRYEQLVSDIFEFGFTDDNRQRLYALADRFEQLAEEDPSRYREDQLDVIQTHQGIWRTTAWERLQRLTAASKGELRAPERPPTPLTSPTKPLQLPDAP